MKIQERQLTVWPFSRIFIIRSHHRGADPAMFHGVSPLDFTQDLHTRILALADLDRVPLIEKLIALDSQARARARAGRRAARSSMVRMHADAAFAESERIGRIIYFLRFRRMSDSATAKDDELCDALAARLTAKGQWLGEYAL